jgi:hypothetical protein
VIKEGGGFPGIAFHLSAYEIAQGENHRVGDLVADRNSGTFPPYQMMVVQDGEVF